MTITLVFPSGNRYALPPEHYRFDANLTKGAYGSIPAGSRWITVHPNGHDEKGVPVLVQEHKPGSGVYHVIGGAGGKLNHLRLRGLKPQSDYKQQSRERLKEKQLVAKEQRKRDQESGMAEAKKAAKAGVLDRKRQKQGEFINTVAQAMGWKDHEFNEADHADLPEAAQKKAREQHHREMLKRAHEAVNLQRDRLVSDQEARAEAGLGGVPLTTEDPDKLSVADIDPVKPEGAGGLGYSTDFKARAEAMGATDEAVKTEAAQVKAEREAGKPRKAEEEGGGKKTAAGGGGGTAKPKGTAGKIAQALETLREEPDTAPLKKLVDAKTAVKLMKAQKALKLTEKAAVDANKDIDKSDRIKAYNLEVSADDPDLDTKVAEDLENNLRTAATRSFLAEVADKDEQQLRRHIGVGAFNSINSLALAAGGDALVDRSVVDVLGIAGAAQVLARRLHADMSKAEIEQLQQGFEDWHVNHYMETSRAALDQAKELQKQAGETTLDEAHDGHDLAAGKEVMRRKLAALAESDKILGTALGEMEANAALVMALRQGRADKPFEAPLGGVGDEDAIRQARAIGLRPGDYSIDKVGTNTVLTVMPAGLDRLSKPMARDELTRVRRNLDIIEGKHDEDDWLPMGVANRPDLGMPDLKPGIAPTLAEPFRPGPDLARSMRDYIGGRIADGDSPADILADLQSQPMIDKAGADRYREYLDALDRVMPLKDPETGKFRPVEALKPELEKMADEFTASRHGGTLAPLHRQRFEVDQKAVDALHRALAAHPEGVAAYKPIGELTNQDQRALREFFHANIAKEDVDAADLRHQLERVQGEEPEKEVEDMFGEISENPDWREWKAHRDQLAEKVNAASLTWHKYAKMMRGHTHAYASIQDLIRSNVAQKFAEEHNRLRPDAPLKLGREVIRGNLNHLDAVDPKARDERIRQERALVDSLRNREGGKYAAGSVADKLDAARERQEAFGQAQIGMFGGEDDLFGDTSPATKAKPLGADERHSLGHAAESQIARMMSIVGPNFRPGKPTKIWRPVMGSRDAEGGKNKDFVRQRAIKHIVANKRTVLAAGVGTGKTLVGLGAFTHLRGQGKAKRGLFLVPSAVQSQFSGEALRYLEPGRFNWHIEPGASQAERIAAYKDPDTHFAVMTHAGFRDDMIHLGAKHAGIDEKAMSERLGAMKSVERRAWAKGVMDKEGINFDYLNVDEGDNLLNRRGKENSALANVVDSVSAHTPYYVSASADPVKNDVSESFDLLAKMDPERYNDRAAFLRRYGPNTEAAQEGLRREMARYWFPASVESGVKADKREEQVELTPDQHAALKDVSKLAARARIARMEGKVDVDAVRRLSPNSFEGVPEDRHEALSKQLQAGLGMVKSAAMRRIIDAHPQGAKVERIAQLAKERKGKPGVVFAHSLDAVNAIADRLRREGHRVVTLTGADSGKDKDAKRLAFQPEAGEAKVDILVASDAAAAGVNLQRGQWLVHSDVPDTARTHAQRSGRIDRVGQRNDVELIDLVANHPAERAARERLKTKYGLRELMTSPMEGLDDSGLGYFLGRRRAEQGG
ncbi:DEAD/DEAH box helicase [Methylomagnum ishizawai]|uniref:helicase-related protein n=1 Tax=Methylomagnum ishizawai TaxID=1760988 RepID=UPI001C32B1D7|nr:DEAD/DEAH box helicase [Methylomagnum ishizawai]BBL75422.1 hypothetical protein MishRS11D_25200 [Methylomagnum ishizawai]